MNYPLVLLWLAASAALALVHWFAIEASLYWYYWWFDAVMHFWGGLLLGVGIHILGSFSPWPLRIRLWHVVCGIGVVVVSWEVFEYWAGLFDPETYVFDTGKDILIGYTGGLLGHYLIRNRYNTHHE